MTSRLLLFPIVALAVFLVYSKTLADALIFDDIGILAMFASRPDFDWMDCFRPMDNGFWRPMHLLLVRSLYLAAETSPLPYHIAGLAIHCAVAVTAGLGVGLLAGAGRTAQWMTALAVGLASAAFPAVYMISNTGDTLMTLFLLLTVLAWQKWLVTGNWWHVALATVLYAAALMNKETAIAGPAALALVTIAQRPCGRRWLGLIPIGLLSGASAMAMMVLQKQFGQSYTQMGWNEFSATEIIRRLDTFLPATLFPGGRVMRPLWPLDGGTGPGALVEQIGVILALAAAAMALLIRRWKSTPRLCAALLLSAAVMLGPALILKLPRYEIETQPGARFVYVAIPFVIMAIALAITLVTAARVRWTLWGLAGLWIVFQVIAIRKSAGPAALRRTARHWKNLASELQRVEPTWPPWAVLHIATGRDTRSIYIPLNYAMATLRVYLANRPCDIRANPADPAITNAYIFDGRRLSEAPASSGP